MAAPNHCLDGWSYAARSTAALLSGDFHGCRHLAYYAQLRAGLSILANLGVGLFNGINFIIDSAGRIHRLDPAAATPRGMGTHAAVWASLSEWSKEPASARLFLELVQVRGVSLADSVEAIWPGSTGTGVAADLIAHWGLDLARGRDEHRFRNISSYNPQALHPLSTDVATSLRLVSEIWELCEPTGAGCFNNLDRFLLRALLQAQHRKINGSQNPASGAIARNYSALSPLIQAIASKDFLTGANGEPDPEILAHARARTKPAEPIEMLSRAYLLLRAATAVTYSSFIEAGLDLENGDLRPWIDDLAVRRGFWRPGEAVADTNDLWADIELALLDFVSSQDPTPNCWHDWMANSQRGVPQIYEMERIGVWSLGA